MKRQQSLFGLGFAKKISRIEISEQQSIKDKMSVSNAVLDAENAGATNNLQCCDKANAFSDCWSNKQYDYFRKKYNGLIVRNKKLGSNHCAKLDSLHKKGISCVTRVEKLQHFSFGKRYNSPASISSKKNKRTFFFKNTSYLFRATATSCK